MHRKLTRIDSLRDLGKLTPEERKIFEFMAALEHQRWAGWQRHLHNKCSPDEEGNLIIPAAYVKNLERQIKTGYEELSEKEKDDDRQEVLKNWQVFAEFSR